MLDFDITVKSGDLYDYMMHHTYSSAAGILGSAAGALMIVAGAMKGTWVFILAGAVLLLYLPWTLFIRSKKQVLSNPSFLKPLHYEMDGECIRISQGEEVQERKWEDMYKAVSTSRSIILYTSRIHACIFPRRELRDKSPQVIQMISTHMPPGRVKIRM